METKHSATQALEDSVRTILAGFDEPNREGLKDTPRRFVAFLEEFLTPPELNFTTFGAEGYDQMIIQTNIPFYSLCEHHLSPFFGVGHIAYVPGEKIVGLSKLARTLEMFARRFQNQERLTKQTADYLLENLKPKGVAVVVKAQHLCMAMRGVRKHDTWTLTSELAGVLRDNPAARSEFLSLIAKT